jgi:hypothetical protein
MSGLQRHYWERSLKSNDRKYRRVNSQNEGYNTILEENKKIRMDFLK